MAFVNSGKLAEKKLFKTIKSQCVVDKKPCPKCHKHDLVQPDIRDAQGNLTVPPTCINCGYKFPITGFNRKKAQKEHRQKAYQGMIKNSAISYFLNYSIQGSTRLDNRDNLQNWLDAKTFKNFKTNNNPRLTKALRKAELCTRLFAAEKNIHVLIQGDSGVGKTFLCYSMIEALWHKLNYHCHILFLDMMMTPVWHNEAIQDKSLNQRFDDILHQIGQADLVIMDDAGRERKTQWNQLIATAIAQERADLPLVVTSNANGLDKYPSQVESRLKSNLVGHIVDLTGVKNHRNLAK